jgi:hypothetical protein
MEIGWLDTPEEWRDFFIMCFAAAGTFLFLVAIFFTVVLGLLGTGTFLRTRRILKDSVGPALENVKQTTGTVRATVSFISDHAVTPVVKAYSLMAGARRFLVVVTRLRGRKKEHE